MYSALDTASLVERATTETEAKRSMDLSQSDEETSASSTEVLVRWLSQDTPLAPGVEVQEATSS